MSKTPDVIKKGLECCMDYQNCTEGEDPQCPYYDAKRCMEALLADALALIQQLEAERDAAVESLRGICEECKHFSGNENACRKCDWNVNDEDAEDCWEWRGVQKD